VKKRPVIERFWEKIDRSGRGCWLWKCGKNQDGHGILFWKFENDRCYNVSPHRLSYEIHFGPIPDGLQVRHACNNPACVNPKHLLLGTHDDNMRDKAAAGTVKGEKNPACKITAADVRAIRKMHAKGSGIKALERRFNVKKSQIHNIVTRKSWGHI
jgi:HNH endonuclease